MKRSVKIIIILLVLNGLVFAAISLVKIKSAAAKQSPDPLTFYCQLEEDYINYSVQNWQEAIAEFSVALGTVAADRGTPGPPLNLYIGVTKTASPPGSFQNNQLPFSVQYTITVTAKQKSLTNIQFQYECKATRQESSIPCPGLNPSIPTPPAEISLGNPFTFSYSQTYTTEFQNSLVVDTFRVRATPTEVVEQTGIASASIAIGNPPTGCFTFDQSWDANATYKANMESAVAYLVSGHPTYAAKVCSGGNLELRYNPSGLDSYWGFYHGSYVDFFSPGVNTEPHAKYILFHEACHALVDRMPSLWSQYSIYPGILSETPRCFYDYAADAYEERLCEAVSFYANDPCGNFQSKYPIHYRFVKDHVYQ